MLLQFFNKLLNLDVLGPEPKLTHKGLSRYSTILGVIFSLFMFALSIFSIVSDLQDVYNKQNPNVFQQEYPNPNEINFTSTNLKKLGLHIQIEYFNYTSEVITPIEQEDFPNKV